MEKRYQVFVSSTYADLKEERQKVFQTLIEMDCIPAGMELFPAADEEQWEFIKRVIDDCDYYIVIIGGRYGSTTIEGISYTEKEYDYAIDKGIKVLAFLHENPEIIPLEKSEKDSELRQRLYEFRKKVSQNRLVKFWTRADELPGLVALSLQKTIKTYPAIGWVRADKASSEELLREIHDLRKENDQLKALLAKHHNNIKIIDIASLDEEYVICGTASISLDSGPINWCVKYTWKNLFKLISPYLIVDELEEKIRNIMSKSLYKECSQLKAFNVSIDEEIFQNIKLQFIALNLIDIKGISISSGPIWQLTPYGKTLMLQIRTIKTKNAGQSFGN